MGTGNDLQPYNPEDVPAVIEDAADVTLTTAGGDRFPGIATLVLTPEQIERLTAKIDETELDILPTGEIYASQVRYRRALNDVFGPGRWALMSRGPWSRQGNTLCREFALFVDGRFIAEAIGEQDYSETNDRMSWATAAEGAKSNALTRCCKDLGIASECWDRRFTATFREQHCVRVWVKQRNGEKTVMWRRKDAAPFYGEEGAADDSGAPRRGGNGGGNGNQTSGAGIGDRTVTDAQIKLIHARADKCKVSGEDLQAYLAADHGIEHVKELPFGKVNEILGWIEAQATGS